ncbi:phosphotransferase family protein [Micromonospora rubida]|uniref:Phosphotransferase family protein n=1 Tax=Micromonospora rubida TaxID=2697657 RepID=A0ABW7SLF2_9ACTN
MLSLSFLRSLRGLRSLWGLRGHVRGSSCGEGPSRVLLMSSTTQAGVMSQTTQLHRVLDQARALSSRRVMDRVGNLRRDLARHHKLPAVAEFAHRLSTAAIHPAAGAFLVDWCDRLEPRLAALRRATEGQLIHGDAHVGNLLREPSGRVVLCDFDATCIGPRQVDLVAVAVGEAGCVQGSGVRLARDGRVA